MKLLQAEARDISRSPRLVYVHAFRGTFTQHGGTGMSVVGANVDHSIFLVDDAQSFLKA
ncbi:MAG: hypothetical protein H0X47_18560 [Nitrospirales bacterium]|nr:hypothetical protein [Nitrospirales bacterium]